MSHDSISGQEEQVNQIFERIEEIVGRPVKVSSISAMIEKFFQMRAANEPDEKIRKLIAGVTGIVLSDSRIEAIISEIEEQPFQNTYRPFENSLFDRLKKDLEKE